MQIKPESLSPGRRYFLMTSCIIPRPIAWTGTLNTDGTYNLAPFSYFNGLGSTPPVVGIGFGPHDEKLDKDTLTNARRTGELSICVPHFELVDKVEATGENLPYGEDEFNYAGLTAVKCDLINAPRVAEAKICFECMVHDIIQLGDTGSTLLLARILLFHIEDTLIDDWGCVDPHKFKALARMAGGRYAPVGDVFKAGESE